MLWAETLLRRTGADEPDLRIPGVLEALESYVAIAERGVPLLANSLAIALRQAELWRALLGSDELPLNLEYRLAEALEFVDRTGRYALSGQGFARFVALDAEFGPEQVLGAYQRPQAIAMMA